VSYCHSFIQIIFTCKTISSLKMNRVDALNAKEAQLRTEALNIIMKSGNDIKVIGSNIDAASDLQLQAANEVLIAAAQELSQSEQWSKKSSFNLER